VGAAGGGASRSEAFIETGRDDTPGSGKGGGGGGEIGEVVSWGVYRGVPPACRGTISSFAEKNVAQTQRAISITKKKKVEREKNPSVAGVQGLDGILDLGGEGELPFQDRNSLGDWKKDIPYYWNLPFPGTVHLVTLAKELASFPRPRGSPPQEVKKTRPRASTKSAGWGRQYFKKKGRPCYKGDLLE